MKNSARNRIIVWSIVSVLLIGVLVWGVVAVNNNIGSLNLLKLSVSGNDLKKIANAEDFVTGGAEFDAKEIKSLDIDWAAGKVEIINGDSDKIVISEDTSSNDSDRNMCWYVDNEGTLSVYSSRKSISLFDIFNTEEQKKLTITIPENHRFDDVDISTASADVNSVQLVADDVDVETASGNIDLRVADAELADVTNVSGDTSVVSKGVTKIVTDNVSGSTEISGEYRKLDATSVSGEIRPVVEDNSTQVIAETVSGNVNFKVVDSISGFMVDHETVSGSLDCEFAGKSLDDKFIYGNASAEFEVETVSGSIFIEKI